MKIGALIVILGVASQVESKGVWINVACIIVNNSLLFELVCEVCEQRRTIGNSGEKKGANWSKCMEAGRRSHVS